MQLDRITLTLAGNGKPHLFWRDEILNAIPVSLNPEDYGIHPVAGGAVGFQRHNENFEYGDNSDGTKLILTEGREVTVLHPREEILEGMDNAVENLHGNCEQKKRLGSVLSGISGAMEDVHVHQGLFTENAKAIVRRGKQPTVQRKIESVLYDHTHGRPLDGSPAGDTEFIIVPRLKKPYPLRSTTSTRHP